MIDGTANRQEGIEMEIPSVRSGHDPHPHRIMPASS